MANHSDAVRAAFGRFDVDQSGSISRQELSEVLKGLDGSWSDQDVDDLLCQADASGDGELQIDEFLKWIFAEDKELGAAYIGQFIYTVSNCSKEELNGDYRQQPVNFNGRPAFMCRENGLFMSYDKRGFWGILTSPSDPPLCRLVTARSPHIAKSQWSLWKEEERSWVKQPLMSCFFKQSPEQVEEECAKAPEIIHHICLGKGESLGLFKKQKETLSSRPIYFNEKTGMYISYMQRRRKWKVSREPNEGSSGTCYSEMSQGYNPMLTPWKSNGDTGIWGTPSPSSCDAVPEGWKDMDFLPQQESIGDFSKSRCAVKRPGAGPEISWERALKLSKERTVRYEPVLFGDITPADALQGAVGNCWMIAAFAQLAEFPSYIKEHIFVTKEVSLEGKYEIRLFDFDLKDWKVVQVDDYLPCFAGQTAQTEVAYADLNGGKMWVALLEKAMAKTFGSYARINGGIAEQVYALLTGCDDHMHVGCRFTPDKPQWVVIAQEGLAVHHKGQEIGYLKEGARIQEVRIMQGYDLQFTKVDGEGPEEGIVKSYVAGKKAAKRCSKFPWCQFLQRVFTENDQMTIEDMDDDEAWARALEMEEKNFLLATSTSFYASDGVVTNHVYSILAVKEVEGLRFVCLRNPWGHGEYKGPWNDEAEEWKVHPAVAEALQLELDNDGKFWMEWEDFTWRIRGFDATFYQMPSKRARERAGAN